MALKTFKPTTPGAAPAGASSIAASCGRASPIKALTEGKREKGGRNNHGRITVR